MFFKYISLFLLLISQLNCTAQSFYIRGKVYDHDDRTPLPFVSISYENGKQGVISDLNGNFLIQSQSPINTIKLSYIGYNSLTVHLPSDVYKHDLRLGLHRKSYLIHEVIVSPDMNPAYRIIHEVTRNRNRNNPEKMHCFSYTSYNKTYVTLVEDSTWKRNRLLPLDTVLAEKTDEKLNTFLQRHNILLIETVTKRNYKYPGKNNEKIVLSRVSGLNKPSIMVLSSKLQSFSFYNNFVTILDKKYLNPISPEAKRKYYFQLEDTLYSATSDTVFIISFNPIRHKNFRGLKGQLYINSDGYAIQNVIATPAHPEHGFNVKIQQQYEHILGKQWFPTQLNTEFYLKGIRIKTKTRELYPVGSSKTYLFDIDLNPESILPFNNIVLQMNNDAYQKNDSRWQQYRYIPLNRKDSATYKVIDSIGRAQQLDQRLRMVEAVMSGYLPLGPVNLNYEKLFGYNDFEGFRLGIGLSTNYKVSSFFSIGGNISYGFHDKKWKNSEYLQLFPSWSSDTRLTLHYLNDVSEIGGYSFLDENILNQSEEFRNILIDRMLYLKEKEADISFRALQYFKFNLYFKTSVKKIPDYIFTPNFADYNGSSSTFHFTETGICFKFAFKEKFIKAPNGKLISMGTPYPMLWFNIRRGISRAGGEFNYTKYELKLSKTFSTQSLGKSSIVLVAGKTVSDIPVTNLYNGHGSYAGFSIDAKNSFATMRMDEFYATSFASLFLRQDFGRILFNSPLFHPDFVLVTNIGFGKLANAEHHSGMTATSFNKGYYESGFLANDLLRSDGFMSMGLGIYYRYGPYTFPKVSKNFCYRLTLNFNLK